MKGELFINGHDAYETWGVIMDDSSLSALMTPAANKEYISDESRLQHGRRMLTSNVKKDARDLSLRLEIWADNRTAFYTRYSAFCSVLDSGVLHIKTKYQSGVVYKCIYQSCQQYTQFRGKVGKFALRLIEPNPTDRAES
jgi:hypothetical protein